MSLSIDTVTIGGIEDRRLVISNDQVARYISIGTSWTALRVGIRLAIDDSGANITGQPLFGLGFLNSPAADMSNGPLLPATSVFVGWVTNAATWTRQAGPPVRYTWSQTNYMHYKVGNGYGSIAATSRNFSMSAQPGSIRGAYVYEFTKAAPSNFHQLLIPSITNSDIPMAEFQSAIGLPDMAQVQTGLTPYQTQVLTPQIAYSEVWAVPNPDSICVYWNRVAPVVRVSDIVFMKVS